MRYLLIVLISLLVLACKKEDTRNPLLRALDSDSPSIKRVMDSLDAYEIQIQLTDLKADTTYTFQINDNNYFYPASTVKFPIAIFALEKVNTLDSITSDTPFLVEGDSAYTTIKNEVTKIFAVSNNDAYNRLYEFLGRDYINLKLKKKGLQPVRISHRLSTTDANNPETKPLVFKINDSTLVQQESMMDSEIEPLQLHKIKKGKGYYKNDVLVNESMDFSEKNYLPISTLHEMMKRIQFPDTFSLNQQFILNTEDQEFLLNTMKVLPRNAGYNETEYYDGYVKFFMFGVNQERIPYDISISKKVGYAYGYLTDCAFIEDTKHDVSYILTATIHVNKNDIFNDDVYEYDTLGIPFLAQLGEEIHQHLIDKN
jgi:hypothetical protein